MLDGHFYDQDDNDSATKLTHTSNSQNLYNKNNVSLMLKLDQGKNNFYIVNYVDESRTPREYLNPSNVEKNASFILNDGENQSSLTDSPIKLSATRRIEFDNSLFEDQYLEVKESILTNVFVKLSEFCDYWGKKQIFEVDWDYIQRPDLEITHTYLTDIAYEWFLAYSLSSELEARKLNLSIFIENLKSNNSNLNEIKAKINEIFNNNSIVK